MSKLQPMDVLTYLGLLAVQDPAEWYSYLSSSNALPENRAPLSI
jgi:hypothetical protein